MHNKPITVYMTTNCVFPWQGSTDFQATLLDRPRGPGDTFVIMVKHEGKEIKVNLNGNCSEFAGISEATDD